MPFATIDLRRRIILIGTPAALGAIALAAYLTHRGVTEAMEYTAQLDLARASRQASSTVDQFVNARAAALRLLAQTPTVGGAARATAREVVRLGLDRMPSAQVDELFAGSEGFAASDTLRALLASLRDSSAFAQLLVTDLSGFTAATTDTATGFVHSGDPWWNAAVQGEAYQGASSYDSDAERVVFELAVPVIDPTSGTTLGAMRGLLDLSSISADFSAAGEPTLEVVDTTGRILASAVASRLFNLRGDLPVGQAATDTGATLFRTAEGLLLAVVPANGGRWQVVAQQDRGMAAAFARGTTDMVWLSAAVAALVTFASLMWLTDWLRRRVTLPVRSVGQLARRVARGDLSAAEAAAPTAANDEVGQLLGSIHEMVGALGRLVGEIRSSAHESAAMAEQISASTEQMSASTQEMADTCQDLSSQANDQAELARQSVADANRILTIATSLAEGSTAAAERSNALLQTAEEHRDRLVASGAQLDELANDLEEGTADAYRLAELSAEIQRFLTQTKAIASQTNMLALNAAIEASRAGGGEGRGFAVVADEVRKLANQAERAAASTTDVVRNVLSTVEETQIRLTRLAESSADVRQVAASAANALEEVASVTAESSAWGGEISRAAGDLRELVAEITGRLERIAGGTEFIVDASEEIAASAEEQSASTEEIASSAQQLANAADRLTEAVGSFRLSWNRAESTDRAIAPGAAPAPTPRSEPA